MWTFQLPTTIHFGSGKRASLPDLPEIHGRRIVVATDSSVRRLPMVESLIAAIAPIKVFEDIRPNPTVANVDSLAEILRREQAEAVLAVGGGSCMDAAKAACLVGTVDSSIRAYHSEGKSFSNAGLPLITVPTTAGTGSEVTPIAVLDDEEKNFKGPMSTPFLYPRCAVVDPELTFSLPVSVTAATALDALSHALEGYWSRNHQPICDTLALESAKIIFQNLPIVYDEPENRRGREALSYAALLAGIAFQMPKNAMIHACSFPLSNRAHLSHGAACALTMEAAIRLNTPCMDGRMEKFARYCGFETVEKMTAAITVLKRRGGLPCTLAEAGIAKEMVAVLIEESFHPLMKNNPKEIAVDDLKKMYDELGGGSDNG